MKGTNIIFFAAVIALASCQQESDAPVGKGVELTIHASVASPETDTRTTYVYNVGTQAGTIATSWEATEKITVVSIGDAGITAVDEFTSTGAAGRAKAEFSGTWGGNPGDRVICLYPAITTTAGAARYSKVTVSSTSIEVSFPAHSPSRDISTIRDYDLMTGDVDISGGTAYVVMKRKIAVLRLGISGAYPWDGDYGYYIAQLGVSAMTPSSTSKLFVTHGTISTLKSAYTGDIVPDAYQSTNRNSITQQSEEGTFYYYVPLLADGTLESGDKIEIAYGVKERSGMGGWKTYNDRSKTKILDSSLTFSPGYVYAITSEL